MCLGIPGKVVAIKGKKAKIKLPDHDHWVDATMIDNGVKIGDYLLTYQDVAINKVQPKQAKKTLRLLNA
jgi:hydrogenase assembly chaperone HypC/HupF